MLAYYKSEADARGSKPPAGTVQCAGATVFLKEVGPTAVHPPPHQEASQLPVETATACAPG